MNFRGNWRICFQCSIYQVSPASCRALFEKLNRNPFFDVLFHSRWGERVRFLLFFSTEKNCCWNFTVELALPRKHRIGSVWAFLPFLICIYLRQWNENFTFGNIWRTIVSRLFGSINHTRVLWSTYRFNADFLQVVIKNPCSFNASRLFSQITEKMYWNRLQEHSFFAEIGYIYLISVKAVFPLTLYCIMRFSAALWQLPTIINPGFNNKIFVTARRVFRSDVSNTIVHALHPLIP